MTDFASLTTTELIKLMLDTTVNRAELMKEVRSRSDIEDAYIEAIPELGNDPNFYLRGMRLLVQVQGVEARDALLPFTMHDDDNIREPATSYYEQLCALYATVSDDDIATRVSWLVKGLDEDEKEVVELSREGLLEIGAEAVPALLDSFNYTTRKEQLQVLWILKEIDYYDDDVFAALKALLYTEDYTIIKQTLATMKAIVPGHIHQVFYKDYIMNMKSHHDELAAAEKAEKDADAAQKRRRVIQGWVRQLSAPDGRSRVDAMRELARMDAEDRKVAEELMNNFDDSKGYGHPIDKEFNTKYINWDIDAIFAGIPDTSTDEQTRKKIEFLLGNLQQSKDGIARVEAANDLVKLGQAAINPLVKALKDTPRPHDVVMTLQRINPIYGRRAREWINHNRKR